MTEPVLAFQRFYMNNQRLPIDLGRHGQIAHIADSDDGHSLDLGVRDPNGSAFVIALCPRNQATDRVATTNALDIWVRSDSAEPQADQIRMARAFARFLDGVEARRGPPPTADMFTSKTPRKRAGQEPERRLHRMELILFPTDACNLRCTYCIVPFGKERLSPAQIDTVFQRIDASDLDWIGLTFLGGEPMLGWEAIVDATERLVKYDTQHSLSMVTNGTLVTPERAAFLGKHDFGMTFSVDGVERAHARERVAKGTTDQAIARGFFPRTLKGLKMTQDTGIEVKANMVVTPKTVDLMIEGVAFLTQLGIELVTLSPAVGVAWGDAGLATLRRQLDAYAKRLTAQIQDQPADSRARIRRVLQWEIRRSWYFMGQDVFNPHTRRVVVGPDGRLFSDLYNDETEALLYLGQLDDITRWQDLPERFTTVPQAMYRAKAWEPRVMQDVLGLSRHLFEVLTQLNAEAFTTEPGAPELVGYMPDTSTFVPVL